MQGDAAATVNPYFYSVPREKSYSMPREKSRAWLRELMGVWMNVHNAWVLDMQ